MSITKKDVVEAAEKIVSAGENPTIEKVRLQLGTGSNTTISKYLNEWRAKQQILDKLTPTTLPPDPVNAAVQHVWLQMQEKTQAEIKAILEKTQQEISFAQNELQQAFEARDHLLQQISELEKRTNQLQADKELLSIDLKSREEANKILQEKYTALQKQYGILEQQTNSRMEELKNELLILNEHYQEHISDLKITNANAIEAFKVMHEDERQRQMMIVDVLKTKEKDYDKQVKKFENEIQQLKLSLADSKSQIHAVSKEKDLLIKANNNKDETISTLRQWKGLEAEISNFKSQIENNFEKIFADQAKLALNFDEKLQKFIIEISNFKLIMAE